MHMPNIPRPSSAILSVLLVMLCVTTTMHADCTDTMLLGNEEPLVRYGIDSTGHWWAITQPFEGIEHLYVDGKRYGPFNRIEPPIFSRSGASWGTVGERNTQWSIVTAEGSRHIEGTGLESLMYPPASDELWYVVLNGTDRVLTNGQRTYRCLNPTGTFAFDPAGITVWYVGQRGNSQALVRNGEDVAQGESIQLGGIWADARPFYAIGNGARYTVYLGDEELASNLTFVNMLQVNPSGTVCAFSAASTGPAYVYMYTDDYIQPWMSPVVEGISDVTLSPADPLVAYRATRRGTRVIMFNNADYSAGLETGPLTFSNNGAFLVYAGRDSEEFFAVNGKRYRVKGRVSTGARLAVHPTKHYVGYSSATTLVMWDVELDIMRLGRMCDSAGPTVYDVKADAFKALGVYGGRLFLMTCRP